MRYSMAEQTLFSLQTMKKSETLTLDAIRSAMNWMKSVQLMYVVATPYIPQDAIYEVRDPKTGAITYAYNPMNKEIADFMQECIKNGMLTPIP